jgi:vacuolar-type H+-ATPase subunit I/STV1
MAENQNTVYLNVLIDTLCKKEELLNALIELTKEQESILAESSFSLDSFDSVMNQKDEIINQLNQVENGFEAIYQRVEKELPAKKDQIKTEILEIQKLIRSVTDKSMVIQALESKNKEKLIMQLAGRRQEIRSFKATNLAADRYHQNMANQHQEGQSYFLDKKK